MDFISPSGGSSSSFSIALTMRPASGVHSADPAVFGHFCLLPVALVLGLILAG